MQLIGIGACLPSEKKQMPMKKTALLLLSALFVIPAFSSGSLLYRKKGGDQWIIIGARGTFNSTWLLSKNQLNDKGIKYQPSFGGSGGIMLGFHYSEWGAIEVEALYSLYNQKLASKVDSMNWSSKASLAYLEFPILLHFDTQNFKYIEAGIKISSLSSAKGTFDFSSSSTLSYSNKDIKENYEKSNLAVVFGWGSGVWGNGGLLVNLGIRLSYGLSDIVSTVGGKGKDYYAWGDGLNAKAKPYTKTNTATIGLHMNIDFDLGWFMTSNCKRSHKFVLFGH